MDATQRVVIPGVAAIIHMSPVPIPTQSRFFVLPLMDKHGIGGVIFFV